MYRSDLGYSVIKAEIKFLTKSFDPISSNEKELEQTNDLISKPDFVGLFHWLSAATDLITVDWSVKRL